MNYVSVDLETTGTDPENCQILELAAVIDDFVSPLDKRPRFHAYLYHEQVTGHPRAMAMNAAILDIIASKQHPDIVYGERNLCKAFARFLFDNGVINMDVVNYTMLEQATAAGKNFGTFDLPFLQKLDGYKPWFHRRVLDPGVLYFNPKTDDVPPATDECCRRAGLAQRTKHEAMDDALIVCELLRHYYRNHSVDWPEKRPANLMHVGV